MPLFGPTFRVPGVAAIFKFFGTYKRKRAVEEDEQERERPTKRVRTKGPQVDSKKRARTPAEIWEDLCAEPPFKRARLASASPSPPPSPSLPQASPPPPALTPEAVITSEPVLSHEPVLTQEPIGAYKPIVVSEIVLQEPYQRVRLYRPHVQEPAQRPKEHHFSVEQESAMLEQYARDMPTDAECAELQDWDEEQEDWICALFWKKVAEEDEATRLSEAELFDQSVSNKRQKKLHAVKSEESALVDLDEDGNLLPPAVPAVPASVDLDNVNNSDNHDKSEAPASADQAAHVNGSESTEQKKTSHFQLPKTQPTEPSIRKEPELSMEQEAPSPSATGQGMDFEGHGRSKNASYVPPSMPSQPLFGEAMYTAVAFSPMASPVAAATSTGMSDPANVPISALSNQYQDDLSHGQQQPASIPISALSNQHQDALLYGQQQPANVPTPTLQQQYQDALLHGQQQPANVPIPTAQQQYQEGPPHGQQQPANFPVPSAQQQHQDALLSGQQQPANIPIPNFQQQYREDPPHGQQQPADDGIHQFEYTDEAMADNRQPSDMDVSYDNPLQTSHLTPTEPMDTSYHQAHESQQQLSDDDMDHAYHEQAPTFPEIESAFTTSQQANGAQDQLTDDENIYTYPVQNCDMDAEEDSIPDAEPDEIIGAEEDIPDADEEDIYDAQQDDIPDAEQEEDIPDAGQEEILDAQQEDIPSAEQNSMTAVAQSPLAAVQPPRLQAEQHLPDHSNIRDRMAAKAAASEKARLDNLKSRGINLHSPDLARILNAMSPPKDCGFPGTRSGIRRSLEEPTTPPYEDNFYAVEEPTGSRGTTSMFSFDKVNIEKRSRAARGLDTATVDPVGTIAMADPVAIINDVPDPEHLPDHGVDGNGVAGQNPLEETMTGDEHDEDAADLTTLYDTDTDTEKMETPMEVEGDEIDALHQSMKALTDAMLDKSSDELDNELSDQEEEEDYEEEDIDQLPTRSEKIFGPFIEPLEKKWHKRVDTILGLTDMDDVVAKTATNVPIRVKDIATIVPTRGLVSYDPAGWLNDEVVNAFCTNLVEALNKKAGWEKSSGVSAPYIAFSSTWYLSVKTKEGANVNNIKRFARKYNMMDEALLDTQAILFPYNTGAHWTIACISGKDRIIAHLDSLDTGTARSVRKSTAVFGIMRQFLQMHLGDLYKPEEWNELDRRSGIQNNSSDCGVFTCLNGLAFALKFHDPGIEFGADHMPHARRALIAMLLNGGFEGDFEIDV